jgi:Uma2 family endonuclease
MLSVLDSPTLRARISRMSVAEYQQLGEFNERGKRTELIRGIVIEKMSKSPLHGTIASLLQDALTPQLPAGVLLRREESLTLRDSEPEPDIAIVTGARRDFLQAHPVTALLAIEVAVTSPEDDRSLSEIYAEAGIAEYWVVLPKERAIEVFRQPEGLAYREVCRYEFTDELLCSTVPAVKIVLADLFVGISA